MEKIEKTVFFFQLGKTELADILLNLELQLEDLCSLLIDGHSKATSQEKNTVFPLRLKIDGLARSRAQRKGRPPTRG